MGEAQGEAPKLHGQVQRVAGQIEAAQVELGQVVDADRYDQLVAEIEDLQKQHSLARAGIAAAEAAGREAQREDAQLAYEKLLHKLAQSKYSVAAEEMVVLDLFRKLHWHLGILGSSGESVGEYRDQVNSLAANWGFQMADTGPVKVFNRWFKDLRPHNLLQGLAFELSNWLGQLQDKFAMQGVGVSVPAWFPSVAAFSATNSPTLELLKNSEPDEIDSIPNPNLQSER